MRLDARQVRAKLRGNLREQGKNECRSHRKRRTWTQSREQLRSMGQELERFHEAPAFPGILSHYRQGAWGLAPP